MGVVHKAVKESTQFYSKTVTNSMVKLHILVVDDDSTSLAIVSAILRTWNYEVMTAKHPLDALSTLREKRGCFDLVVTDYHMPDMNGFELQKQVQEEFKLPVIMMSADDRESVMLKSLEGGAVFYIVKPVKPDDLKNVWQYAVSRRKGKFIATSEEGYASHDQSVSIGASSEKALPHEDVNTENFSDGQHYLNDDEKKGSRKDCKRKKRKRANSTNSDNGNFEGNTDFSMLTTPRKSKVVWTTSLHNLFLHAINYIGLDKAVPRNILDFMNIPGLTRENVASHLQKYRIFLKKVADKGIPKQQDFETEMAPSSGYGSRSTPPSLVTENVQQQLPHLARSYPQNISSGILPGQADVPKVNPMALADRHIGSAACFPSHGQRMFDKITGVSNPYQANSSTFRLNHLNTGGPYFPSSIKNISCFGPTNSAMTSFMNPVHITYPQLNGRSSSSGVISPNSGSGTYNPSFDSNHTTTNLVDTQTTGRVELCEVGQLQHHVAGSKSNGCSSNSGFIMSPIGSNSTVTAASNYVGEVTSLSGPCFPPGQQDPCVELPVTEQVQQLVYPPAAQTESCLTLAAGTQPPVVWNEERNAYDCTPARDTSTNVRSPPWQHIGEGDLFDIIFKQSTNPVGEEIMPQEVVIPPCAASTKATGNELQRIEISNSVTVEDATPRIAAPNLVQRSGYKGKEIAEKNNISQNACLSSKYDPAYVECSNQQHASNQYHPQHSAEPNTSANHVSDEQIWDDDFINSLLAASGANF